MATKYAVLGAGCIGSCVGILLAANKFDVSFVGRSSSAKFQQLEQKRRLRLTLPEPGAEPLLLENVATITSDEQKGLEGRQVVFVATKRTANKTVAETIARCSPSNAIVVLLQNGLEASKDMADVFKAANRTDIILIDSVVSFNVVEKTLGEFSWVSKRSDSCIALDGSSNPSLRQSIEENICAAIRASGLDSYVEAKFIEIATGKLVINLINAPNALAGCDTNDMLLAPGYRKVWGESVKEARRVFQAMGVPVQRAPRDKGNFLVQKIENVLGYPTALIQVILMMKQTKGGKTSMLQDLENRAEDTEIDYITGRIVSLGKEFNIPTPVSEKLVELVKQATLSKQGSPRMSPEQLVQAVGIASPASTCTIT